MCIRDRSDAETSRARAQLKSGLLMSLESTSARCGQLAQQLLLFGKPLPHREIIEKIDRVTPEQLKSLVSKLLNNATPTMITLGPNEDANQYQKVLGRIRI